MAQNALLQLAQDLEWLGCELEYYGHHHALEGFPQAGPTWETFLEKQRGVLATADKLERELKNTVRYNPQTLVGVDYPIGDALDSITLLMVAVEDIKRASVFAVQELPQKVRDLRRTVATYLSEAGSLVG